MENEELMEKIKAMENVNARLSDANARLASDLSKKIVEADRYHKVLSSVRRTLLAAGKLSTAKWPLLVEVEVALGIDQHD